MARAARQVPVGRQLATADRRRLLVSVIGIGAALGLILLLEGLWTGLLHQASAYEEHVGAGFARQAETRALVEGAVPVDSTSSVRAVPPMMMLMMRGSHGAHGNHMAGDNQAHTQRMVDSDARIAELEHQVASLQARLEHDDAAPATQVHH